MELPDASSLHAPYNRPLTRIVSYIETPSGMESSLSTDNHHWVLTTTQLLTHVSFLQENGLFQMILKMDFGWLDLWS